MTNSNLHRTTHAFGESAMGNLKQTILEQELTFRNQVRELHRLYWTQKNLMKELRQNGLNGEVGNFFYRNEGGALVRNYGRNFDLQLPADAFVRIELNSSNNNDNNSLSKTDRLKVNREFDVEKRLLSSVGSGCKEIIDLEDSIDLDRHEKKNVSFQENDDCCVPSMVHFGEAKDRRLKEKMAFYLSCAGTDDSSLDSATDHYKLTHETRTVLFDLNIPLGDSEIHKSSQDSMLAANYTKNCNDIEGSKLDINVLSSAYRGEGSIGSTDGALSSINETPTPISSIELPKQEKGVSSSNKLRLVAVADNNWQDSNIKWRNSMNILQTLTRSSTEKQSNHEESEEGTLTSSHATTEDEAQKTSLLEKFYVRYNPNSMCDCSSYEKGIQEPATLSITDDSVITNSHGTDNEMSYFKSKEQDIVAKAAARTLMAISFGRQAITTKKFNVTEVTEMPFEEDKSDQLQASSESFEAMTMHLTENQNEEIMPDIPRLNVRQKDEMRAKPKRGKSFRNFQKEILPGLVSLSRHEICEDLYSINYKFRRNAFGAQGNFFVPATRRRSRRYAGRRRRRSFYDQC